MKKIKRVLIPTESFIPSEDSSVYDVVLEFRRYAPSVISQVRKYRCVIGKNKGHVVYSYRTSDCKTCFEYFGSLKVCAKQFRNYVHDVVSLDFLQDGETLLF